MSGEYKLFGGAVHHPRPTLWMSTRGYLPPTGTVDRLLEKWRAAGRPERLEIDDYLVETSEARGLA